MTQRQYKTIEGASGCGALILFSLIFVAITDSKDFWGYFFFLVFIAALIIFSIKFIKKSKIDELAKRKNSILTAIQSAGLEEYINNFISRFGLGQEKDKNVWVKRNYKISWNRINDLIHFLDQKGIKLSPAELCGLLSDYIENKEYNLTINSIAQGTNNFSKLSGSDFEHLLYRLYEAMGYSVQSNGKIGDQGGDLIATKDQKRILVQAKCYKNWNAGNSAIQEAVAAKNHYDCNEAVVVTTSNFTKEAIELAKTNNVKLIAKDLLQKMLSDNLKESWN